MLTQPLRRAARALRSRWHLATASASARGQRKTCPVCKETAERFMSYGSPPRLEARCPTCGALERHRLLWLFLTRETDFFDGRPKRVLHVAPEAVLESRFQTIPRIDYLTADLHDPQAMEVMDVTRIGHPDQSFDVIFCSHVLEHVEDDRQAMREFHRTLRDGGWAILLVPITADHTVEDPSVTAPEERKRLFGQADHVRRYGPDYAERLREAGFSVSVRSVSDIVAAEDRAEYAIPDGVGPMYLCSKTQRS